MDVDNCWAKLGEDTEVICEGYWVNLKSHLYAQGLYVRSLALVKQRRIGATYNPTVQPLLHLRLTQQPNLFLATTPKFAAVNMENTHGNSHPPQPLISPVLPISQ